jgi:hypothetical protein
VSKKLILVMTVLVVKETVRVLVVVVRETDRTVLVRVVVVVREEVRVLVVRRTMERVRRRVERVGTETVTVVVIWVGQEIADCVLADCVLDDCVVLVGTVLLSLPVLPVLLLVMVCPLTTPFHPSTSSNNSTRQCILLYVCLFCLVSAWRCS